MVNPNSPTPQGSRRPVAVLGTLLPHLHPERHHVYRDVTALALLAALIAAGFGSLPVALVLTAVALPAAVLVYIHDHRLWHDEPITVIVVAFGLSLLLGVGVGLLQTHFIHLVTAGSTHYHLPSVPRILELGLLVPVAAFVAVVIAPLVISARPSFRHPLDVVVAGSLSGAALSLGLSVVVQHGAFTHVQVTAGDPAHVAFIALTLGFLCAALFIWIADNYGPIAGCLTLGGVFLLLLLVAAIAITTIRRRQARRAALRAQSVASAMWQDPAILATGLRLTKALGVKRAAPLLMLGAFAIGLLLSRSLRGTQGPSAGVGD